MDTLDDSDDSLLLELDPNSINALAKIMSENLIETIIQKPEDTLKLLSSDETVAFTYAGMSCEEAVSLVSLDLISSYTAGLTDPLGQLRDWFVSVFNSVASWIVSGIQTFINQYVLPFINAIPSAVTSFIRDVVMPAIGGVASTISNFVSGTVLPALTGLGSSILNFITNTVVPSITGFITNIVIPAITNIGNFITNSVIPALTNIPKQISDFVTGTIIPAITNIGSTIYSFISGTVLPAISGVGSTIASFISNTVLPAISRFPAIIYQTVVPALQQAGQLISSGIMGFINQYVLPAISGLGGVVKGFVDSVMNGINTIVNNVTAGFQAVANIFTGFVNAILTFPEWFPRWFMDNIAKPISEALAKVGEWIWNALPDWLRGGLVAIADFFTKTLPQWFDAFIKGLQEFIKDPLGFIDRNIIQPLMAGLKAIGEWIWNALPDWFKNVLMAIYDFFTKTLPEGWNAFVNGVKAFVSDPLGFIDKNIIQPLMAGLKAIGEWIWNALPDWFKGALTSIYDFFTKTLPQSWDTLVKGIQSFLSDPWGWFDKNIVQPVFKSLGWVWEQLVNIGKTIWDWLQGAVNWLVDALKSAFSWIVGLGHGIINAIYTILEGLAKGIGSWIEGIVKGIVKNAGELFKNLFKPNVEQVFKELGIGTPEMLKVDNVTEQLAHMSVLNISALLIPLFCQLIPRLITKIAMAGGKYFEGLDWKWHVSLKPFGIGIETDFDVGKALGASLYVYGEEIMEWLRVIGNSYATSWGFWLARPQVRMLTYGFRNWIPVELPPQNDIIEFSRRVLPVKAKKDVFDMAKFFLAIYGYSDWVLDMYFEPKNKYILEVNDRFGNTRKIPLSLIYELPSASDVATMMVRDIFPSIDEFKKLYLARGMHEDIGALYYYMRFKYPPPEKLWQYTTRGISGFLWSFLTDDIRKRVEAEAKEIGASVPLDSYDLNFRAKELLNAFQNYMKWHDYAMFSWIEGFTSDNQIIIDTQAEIPAKIDQRWMARFGIYELMSKKGISISSPIDDFRKKVIETAPTSNIVMDLTLFSRGLQATGLHPDLVPITAVAETINAISDERNMLRTASLNLFKEGFWNTGAIEMLLSGALVASFLVAYFNTETLQWEKGWINLPLMFLPPERKIVEVRALMDRAMDILKEIQRDVTTAYQENILLDYESYKKTLTEVIDKVNYFFAEEYENITNTPLPDELKLQFVEEYYKPYVDALSTFRNVHIIRRIRAWTQRWLGWIMYRVATGVASLEDTEELIKLTSTRAVLTNQEVEFLQEVMKIMYRIATREYIPSPSQLLTMSEYVSIPSSLIDKVFEARFISKEWADIWKQYISIRTIADDVKALISTYMYVLRYIKVPEDISNLVKNYARKIGFGKEELYILELRAKLEEMLLNSRADVREYIPSPSMLASMSEYLPEIREFFDDVVKAKNIPEQWRPLWAKYIDIRPLVNDVKTYLSRAEQLYARFMITEEEFKKVLEQVKDYLGYTDKEVEFLLLTTRYERHRTAWTELIGDVDRMVMLAEYSPKAREFALGTLYKMIDALPIEQDTKNLLKKMWEDFIKIKPVKEEVTSYVRDLINLYVDGLLSDKAFEDELEALREWGLDDYEIMFYKAIAGMRRARKLKITVA